MKKILLIYVGFTSLFFTSCSKEDEEQEPQVIERVITISNDSIEINGGIFFDLYNKYWYVPNEALIGEYGKYQNKIDKGVVEFTREDNVNLMKVYFDLYDENHRVYRSELIGSWPFDCIMKKGYNNIYSLYLDVNNGDIVYYVQGSYIEKVSGLSDALTYMRRGSLK